MNIIVTMLERVWEWIYRATGAAALDRWLANRRSDEYTDLAHLAAGAGVSPDSVAILHDLAAHERDRGH